MIGRRIPPRSSTAVFKFVSASSSVCFTLFRTFTYTMPSSLRWISAVLSQIFCVDSDVILKSLKHSRVPVVKGHDEPPHPDPDQPKGSTERARNRGAGL